MKSNIIILTSIIFGSFGLALLMNNPFKSSDFYEVQSYIMLSLMITGALSVLYFIILEIRNRPNLSDKDKLFWTIILITTNYFGFAFYIVFGNEKIFK